jgi:hypothetical protein
VVIIFHVRNFICNILFNVGSLFVKRVAGDGNCLFRSHAILLETISYYFVLRYLIAEAETVLRFDPLKFIVH